MREKELRTLVMTDNRPSDIASFVKGVKETIGGEVGIASKVVNGFHGSKLNNLKRYAGYFLYPLTLLRKRKQYDVMIGWQQFYANNLALYCRVLRSANRGGVILSANFTYKAKKGLIGRVYGKYMKYAIDNSYLDAVHLPSHVAARNLQKDLGVGLDRIVVAPFGIDDISDEMANYPFKEKREYVFSIGRSNRDFDFLVKVWSEPCLSDKLLIIAADQWKPKQPLPTNIIHLDNLHGKESHAYQYHAKATVIPIDDGELASGDTVLLHAMSFSRPIIITSPSTLAEMYIENGVDGLVLPKNVEQFAKATAELLNDEQKMNAMGKAARDKYEKRFSQYALGVAIGTKINEILKKK